MPKHNKVNLGEYRDVWVIVEHAAGKAAPVSWECLRAGRELVASLGGQLAVVVIGDSGVRFATDAFAYGADVAYMIDGPAFKHYRTEAHLLALKHLVQMYHPEVLLMGATATGCDLSAALAVELQTGLAADCTHLSVEMPRRMLQMTRPVHGGHALATLVCERQRPQIATVRPRVLPLPVRRTGHMGRIERVEFKLKETDIAGRILGFSPHAASNERLAEAEVIVAIGRGLGSAAHLPMVEALARALGGVLGATRAAVARGWLPATRLIGATGMTVRPRLYLAIGISGASRHLAGMRDAGTIIAINRDPDAPIFAIATHGVIGDLCQVVPEMTRQVINKIVR